MRSKALIEYNYHLSHYTPIPICLLEFKGINFQALALNNNPWNGRGYVSAKSFEYSSLDEHGKPHDAEHPDAMKIVLPKMKAAIEFEQISTYGRYIGKRTSLFC